MAAAAEAIPSIFERLAEVERLVQSSDVAHWQTAHSELALFFAPGGRGAHEDGEEEEEGKESCREERYACGCTAAPAPRVFGRAENTCALLLRAQVHFRLKLLTSGAADAATAFASCLEISSISDEGHSGADEGAGEQGDEEKANHSHTHTHLHFPLRCQAAYTLAMVLVALRAWAEARDVCVAVGRVQCGDSEQHEAAECDGSEGREAVIGPLHMHRHCRCQRLAELHDKCEEEVSQMASGPTSVDDTSHTPQGKDTKKKLKGKGAKEKEESDFATAEKPRWKYPRTRHACDPGGTAVARDDLLMDPKDVQRLFLTGQRVLVEEKVDGANLGISLAPDGTFLVQNRGHFVTAATHSQFTSLPAWLARHREALVGLLQGPGQYVLFGEWMYARHSLAYDRLPCYFLAFDLFHCHTGRFLAHNQFRTRLAGTGIATVPQIAHRTFASLQDLLALLNTPSEFYPGYVEGIYLRVEDEYPCSHPDGAARLAATAGEDESDEDEAGVAGAACEGVSGSDETSLSSAPTTTGARVQLPAWRRYVRAQAKIVRPDFVQGITSHWAGRVLERNKLAFD